MKNKILSVLLCGLMIGTMLSVSACSSTKKGEQQADAEQVIADTQDETDIRTTDDQETTNAEDQKETEAQSEEGQNEANDVTDATETALPAYEYPGPELFYSVLYGYLIDELGKGYEPTDVSIPCPIIIAEDESNKDDILVWGDFWINNYNLNGDTLETVSGGSYPGVIHMKATSEGYEVAGMEVVSDGSGFTESAKKIFGDYYDEFMEQYSDSDKTNEIRYQIIANYVAANNLSIKAVKDFGWDPVELPEENIDSFYSILD